MRNRVRAVIVAATALVVVGGGMAAANADVVEDSRNQPIVGNFTLDKFPDTATLGHDPLGCTVKVDRVYNYGLKSTKWYRYDIPGLTNPKLCPDMGVAVPTGKPWTPDDLVVTWFIDPMGGGYQQGNVPAAFVLRNFTVVSSFPGEFFPSYIGTGVDFNGDGLPDIYERTDEGEGFRTYLRSGDTFVSGPASFPDDQGNRNVPVFGSLFGQSGTDVVSVFHAKLPGDNFYSFGVIAVSGSTGASQVLVSSYGSWPQYAASLVDYNGDGVLDVKVTTTPSPGFASTDSYYLNDGAGHFTLAP